MGCESGEELFEQTLEEGNDPIDFGVDNPIKKEHACHFEGCNARFNRPYRLEQHLRVHKGERPYRCTHGDCKKSYTSSSHLNRHVISAHSPATEYKKSFRCNYPGCGLSIRHEGNLRRHYMRVHNPKQREFQCGQCPRSFAKNRQLMAHTFEHTGVAPFRCALCDRGFMREALLLRHERTHAEYRCEVPGCLEQEVVFERWFDLCRHRRTCHPVAYDCEICGHVFPSKMRLATHINSHLNHEDKEVYACPHGNCSRYYQYKKNLQTHINVVHEGKRFPCTFPGCSKNLSCKAKLRCHMKLHEPGYDSGRRYPSGPDRKRRKDAGIPKRSWAAKLSGAKLSLRYEKTLAEMSESNFELAGLPDNRDFAFSTSSDKAAFSASDKAPSKGTSSPQRNKTPDTYIKEEQISD